MVAGQAAVSNEFVCLRATCGVGMGRIYVQGGGGAVQGASTSLRCRGSFRSHAR